MNRTKALVLPLFAPNWVIVVVIVVVILAAARDVYDGQLAQAVQLSGDPRPAEIGALLALAALFAVLSIGVIRTWRWTFWLILVVFLVVVLVVVLAGILRLPAAALQLVGTLPRQGPGRARVVHGASGDRWPDAVWRRAGYAEQLPHGWRLGRVLTTGGSALVHGV
jgi:hypothetical protein